MILFPSLSQSSPSGQTAPPRPPTAQATTLRALLDSFSQATFEPISDPPHLPPKCISHPPAPSTPSSPHQLLSFPPLQAPLSRFGSVTSHWKLSVVSHYTSNEIQPFQSPPESCTVTSHCPLFIPLIHLFLFLDLPKDLPKVKVLAYRVPSSWYRLPNLKAPF